MLFVVPGTIRQRSFAEVRENAARFARKCFGSASRMKIEQNSRGYLVQVLSEGHPIHDPDYVNYIRELFERFFTNGFGVGTQVKMNAKLMAGSRQDGTPSEQLLILPPVSMSVN